MINLNTIIAPLLENKEFDLLKNLIEKGKSPVLATGVLDSQKAHLIYGIESLINKSSLIIASSELKAKEIYEDMQFFIKDKIMYYPSKDIIFYSADVKSTDIIKKRFEVIDKLISGEKISVVLSVEALFDRLVEKNIFKNFIIEINEGDSVDINELAQKLVFMGYERCELVEAQGQFAIRGGIIDLYSSVMENAVRIEFWDDEVDSIRLLDSFSQRSVEKTDGIRIFPMREIVYDDSNIELAVKNIKSKLNAAQKQFKKNDKIEELNLLNENINEVLDKLENEKSFSGVDKYLQFFYENTATFLDYINKDTVIYFDEPMKIAEHAKVVLTEFEESIKNRILKGYMLPEQAEMVYDYSYILNKTQNFSQVLFSSIISNIKDFKLKEIIGFNVKSSGIIKNNFDAFVEELEYLRAKQYRILFLAGPRTKCERMQKELIDRDLPVSFIESFDNVDLKAGIVYIAKGSLNKGFEYTDDKFIIVTDKDAFGEEKKKKKQPKKRKNGAPIESFTDLKIGDYVVHDNYGIGVFRGIEKIVSEGVSKDYIKLGYADEGNLYVAINQMDMVQKYIGGEAHLPKLNKLGTQQWEKAKAKAKKAAMILAEDLVKLYAKRQAAKGFIYSRDTVWQREFEESFPYEETDDQLNAINDVKDDMESERVMDRLICGDVGFGKTEVAIRAAFKAVQDDKQVAFLVPTTILAQQHYSTFIKRMENFPVEVSMLSRFRTPKQQKETISGLEKGNVDIVIGTHRILSKDLKFKNLGLIIVDEEQRFGVAHKEKFKTLKENVDILTLSATPIPRTLHMSMTGIRDMSILEEPPGERIPIQTYVMEYNPEFVKDAIHRELARGGQVYYLHNRVRNIADVAMKLQNLVPEATVQFAHGQMSERELENIMMDFMQNNINVLVCTTIIETGLDIPNVNTIIIQDADLMGLSQLYQLRGRVGRSNRTSFAYLMYKKDKVLREVSEKRLQTIKEFTEFGSGFKVAMRDLEIRGAGNLLGAEQHGHMDTVGYDMYCKLLDMAVRELKGEEITPEFETLIDVNLNAFIPPKFIKNEIQKLEMYKKISLIRNEKDFYDVQDELEDRFGTMPNSVQNLLDIALMKAYAHDLGVVSIIQRGKKINISFKEDNNVKLDNLTDVIVKSGNRLLFNGILTYNIKEGENNFVVKIRDILKSIM